MTGAFRDGAASGAAVHHDAASRLGWRSRRSPTNKAARCGLSVSLGNSPTGPTDDMIKETMQARVLLIDDQPMVLEKLRLVLGAHSDIVLRSETGAEAAVAAALEFRPTVILQDLIMPGIDGYGLLSLYRAAEELANVPVVILSASDDAVAKERCFLLGANDYLVKLPETVELVARIRYHSASYLARAERDEAFRLLIASQADLAAANALLSRLNGIDELTGVGNRRSFDAAMAAEWSRGLRRATPLSLVMCDIDHFKHYNDHFGHVAGDYCIKAIAAVLAEQLRRPTDKLARYGGEEFAIVLPDTDLAGALLVAEGCRKRVESVAIDESTGLRGPVTMSFGVASLVPNRGASIQGMVEAADAALFEAKRGGRNTVRRAPR